MAQGDLMNLRTLNLLGDYGEFEVDSDANGFADSFTIYLPDAHVTTYAGSLDNTAPHSGTYNQKITFTTDAASTIYLLKSPRISLIGREDLSGNGHYGSIIKASGYMKRGDANAFQARLDVSFYDVNGTFISAASSDIVALTDSWALFTVNSAAIPANAVVVTIAAVCSVAGAVTGAIFHVDSLDVYEDYTFAKNPSMPEQAGEEYVRKDFRDISGELSSFIHNADQSKVSGTLNFGLITEAQMKAFYSLWSWKMPLIFTPNLNKLPTTLNIQLAPKFEFNHVSTNLVAGYSGSLKYEEI